MNSLKTLNQHCLDSKQRSTLSRPVPRGPGTILLAPNHHQRRIGLGISLCCREDRHLLSGRLKTGPSSLRTRRHCIAQPNVREGTAHHDFMIPSTGSV